MNVLISHRLPGRLRLEIADMQRRPLIAYRVEQALLAMPGVLEARCNPDTGRALIRMDERRVSAEQIVQRVERMPLAKQPQTDSMQVAATSETVSAPQTGYRKEVSQGLSKFVASATPDWNTRTEPSAATPAQEHNTRTEPNPYRVPLVASAGLLGAFSLKRLFWGRSALASAPGPFLAAAGFSIIAGYPSLRHGVESGLKHRRRNPDLWLGAAALGLAVMRENLLALSAITLLNLAMYRRHEKLGLAEPTMVDPELERHGRRMTTAATWLAPVGWLLTGNPLVGLAVLLAANPRPVFQAHKHAWAHVERNAHDQGVPLPQQGNLEALAYAKTIVIADHAQLSEDARGDVLIERIGEKTDPALAANLAASLLKNVQNHPLRESLLHEAKKQSVTERTAFHVKTEGDSVRGTINGHDTYLGPKESYHELSEHDLIHIRFIDRRMRRNGYKPYLLVQDGMVLALFGSKQRLQNNWRDRVAAWQEAGFEVRCLQTGEHVPCELEMMTPHQIQMELDAGRPVAVIGEHELPANPLLARMNSTDLDRYQDVLNFCRDARKQIERDLQVVKNWNKAAIGLALVSPISAPLINLLGDFVGLSLMARHWRTGQATTRPNQAIPEQGKNNLLHARHGNDDRYHALSTAEVLQSLGSRLTGLTAEEVLALKKRFGQNELEAPEPPHPLGIFFGQFKEFSTMILLGASAVSLLMGEPFNALCMGGILVVNAIIGTYQEVRSASILQALQSRDSAQAKVVRDGSESLIKVRDLVPGDIVLLEAGDSVPADIRVVESWNLEVNESILTGETVPAAKHPRALPEETGLADRSNLLFMGTTVTTGRVKGVVVATGLSTQIGAIQSLLQQDDDGPTPLQQKVDSIGKRFVIGALVSGVLVGVVGLMRGMPPLSLLLSSITLAASAIPEGLPLTITIALTAGVMRMAKRNAVVRKLSSLESLGRVTIICSDKTGTLTRNEMTVKQIVTMNDRLAVSGDGFNPHGHFTPLAEVAAASEEVSEEVSEDVRQLLTIGLLCNNASLEQTDGNYKAIGDPTEAALLVAGLKAGLTTEKWTRHREIPFDSNTGSMSVVCQEQGNNCLVLTKGAPESIVKKCTQYLENGSTKEMTDEIRERIVAENLQMAEQALRVLGFAYRELCDDEEPHAAEDTDLIFVGLMGMMDPPKEDVAASIAEARALGIKSVMITGDHPVTARAIGQQLGIYQKGDSVLTGEDLERLSVAELAERVKTASIFARVSPEHKLRIVEAYQSNGEVVAMTGDGVNDAPAIRKADVGIAMGEKGTDITKNTAGIVLMHDHFQAIVEGVKEGRTIIGNIRKAIGCLLTGNFAEVLVTATAVIMGLPIPLVPLQVLLMNLLTDALPAMVLATNSRQGEGEETPRQNVVDKALYRRVLTRGAVLGIGSLAVFAGSLGMGVALPIAQTMAFTTLVAGQLIQTVSWRQMGSRDKSNWKNDRMLFAAMGVSWLALAAAIYVPALQGIFATAPLNPLHWAVSVGVAASVSKTSNILLRERAFDHAVEGSFCQESPRLAF